MKYHSKDQYVGQCLFKTLLTGDNAADETKHMIFNTTVHIIVDMLDNGLTWILMSFMAMDLSAGERQSIGVKVETWSRGWLGQK